MVRALRHRDYRLFFLGQIISLTGTWSQMLAQSWLVYRLTSSEGLLGLIGFTGQIPVFLFATIGGMNADRRNRRHILLVTQSSAMVLAFVLAGLTLTGAIQVWHIFVLAALMGIVNAFDMPTRQAFVVDLVGQEDLVNAIALNSSMFNGARIVGPAVAGVIVSLFGEGGCFLINAVSYVAVLISLLMMRSYVFRRTARTGRRLAHVAEGFGYAVRTRPIRALLLLLGLISLMGMPYAVLMPVFARDILHGGPRALGYLMSATGLGALAGALTLATRRSVHGLGRWVAFSAAAFGMCLVLFTLSRTFWLSCAVLVPVGFFWMLQMASSNTLVQSMVPNSLRGRVMAVRTMMFMGMAPLGALYAGNVAEHVGAPLTVAIGGSACVIGAVVFGFHLPRLAEEGRGIITALQMTADAPPDAVTGAGVDESRIDERPVDEEDRKSIRR